MINKIALLRGACFALALLNFDAYAAQNFSLDGKQVIKANISSKDKQRITVEDDYIVDAFLFADSYAHEKDEKFGQLFLIPLGVSDKPVSLTIITKSGITQDLLLTPKDIQAEPIILKSTFAKAKEVSKVTSGNQLSIINLIKDLACERNVPNVKYEAAKDDSSLLQTLGSFEIKKLKSQENSNLKGSVYELTNKKTTKVILNEKLFYYNNKIAAISIKNKELSPSATTKIYLVEYK